MTDTTDLYPCHGLAPTADRRRGGGSARRTSEPTAIGSLSSRPTPPSRPNTCCSRIFSAESPISSWSARSASTCAPASGRRRLAAVSRRRLRHQRQREGLFRAEDDRRRPATRRICAARARRSSRAAERREQRVQPLPARSVRRAAVARRCPPMPVEIMLLPRWFPFHLRRSPTGRARCSCRCWCCRRSSHARAIRAACASTSCSPRRRSEAMRDRPGAAPDSGSGSKFFDAVDGS